VVTASPFKQQDSALSPPAASNNTVKSNGNSQTRPANQPIGKIKINDQFLQSSSAPSQNQTSKPVSNGFRADNFGTVNKTSVYQPNHTANIVNGERKQELSSSSIDAAKSEAKTVEPNVSSPEQVKPVEQPVVVPTAAASIKPPAFLRNQSEENDDEWGENVDVPVDVAPTYGVAPLASYDETEESFSSLNRSQQQNGNNTSLNHQEQFVSIEAYAEQHTTASTNGHRQIEEQQHQNTNDLGSPVASHNGTGLVAVALYDYQAADDDEISFDPNDIITHIEQVCLNLIINLINSTLNVIFLQLRLMMVGGEVFVAANMVCFQLTMSNCSQAKESLFF
jgi:hypothetical protein